MVRSENNKLRIKPYFFFKYFFCNTQVNPKLKENM